MVTFTEEAKGQILAAIQEQQDERILLRMEAHPGHGPDFNYGMRLIGPDEKTGEDQVIDVGGFEVVLDPESAKNLEGASIDFENGAVQSGFRIDNPNRPPAPGFGEGARQDLSGPLVERVQALLDTELNPAVASHGGMIRLVDVRDNKVYLAFGGGCHGCGMVDVTLKHGVEARIKEAIPEIEEVIDTTDHGTGQTPYYR
ncbi:MAG: iron-sulfur cluster assembly accessory protein [Acidobacteria bacterium]|nr:MAG: iron-sulfur cluster assembly accessory protein [Acidobacteriota bacterium]